MRRSERLVRAGLVACLATSVAAAMHVAAGGAIPAIPGIVVPLILAFVASTHLAGKPLSRWRLGAAVVIAQGLFHASFALGAEGARVVATGGGMHAIHQTAVPSVEVYGTPAGHAHAHASMLVGHAVAAIATYMLLRRADVLVALLRRIGGAVVARMTLTVPRLGTHLTVPIGHGRIPITPRVSRCPRGLRGPPLALT